MVNISIGHPSLNLIVVTTEPFPIGMAATNRILSYSKGLVELGVNLNVLTFKPSINSAQPKDGTYNSVRYRVVTRLSKPPSFKVLLPLYFLIGLFYSAKALYQSKRQKNVLLLVSNKPLMIVCYYIIAKVLRYKYLQEKSEFPFFNGSKSAIVSAYQTFYTNAIYRLFDGIIVMTKALQEYFATRIKKNASLLLLPMTVETDRFKGGKEVLPFDYIAYCGYMGNSKDGVDILIEAFALVAHKHKTLKLVLIGDGPHNEMEKFKLLISKHHLEDRVFFTGQVSREEMPDYLCNAKLLVLARPYSLQSIGGFPTKLGEYLSTGKPVVATRVGEIPDYLVDHTSAYLCEPDNPKAFSECLDEVLSNYDAALEVGRKGREVALESFSHKNQARKLLAYLTQF